MKAERTGILLKPDASRVLLSPFKPPNAEQMFTRIISLTDVEVSNEINLILEEFGNRHRDLQKYFLQRYKQVEQSILNDTSLSDNRKKLIGAYLTSEYSIESAALFNPCIVWHPDQTKLLEGSKRFILTLRATGEGHISSIVFHTGIIEKNGTINMLAPSKFVTIPDGVSSINIEKEFVKKLFNDLGIDKDIANKILNKLRTNFLSSDLEKQIAIVNKKIPHKDLNRIKLKRVLSTVRSNYLVSYSSDKDISEQIIFPYGPTEVNGIEDARFVQFLKEDGSFTYYATYTAYDGHLIQPQLIETPDFVNYTVSTLHGPEVKNKGMAIFPKKINGMYATLSRQDGENLYIMFSNNILLWDSKQILLKPKFEWELVQIGNCGSPIETEKGWLVLSHGVGAMRKYSIGAFLLDLKDPSKVIGRLKEPLISPEENEREGYVPNVVYSCGSIVYRDELIIPYAMSDSASSFAKVNLDELLTELTS
jgi:predicted GH43/DUF377 family glycosyl hydrolase